MTLREILIGAGLTEAKADEVLATMKTNKIFTASEENLDIRYGKLKTDHDARKAELDAANKTIEGLKAASGDNEAAKAKIAEYEKQVKDLQDNLASERLNNAVTNALRDAKAKDIDYLKYKLGNELKLNEKGEIDGWSDKLAALKKDHADMFEPEGKPGTKVIPNKLNNGAGGEHGLTKAEVMKLSYSERAELYQKDPDAYNALMAET